MTTKVSMLLMLTVLTSCNANPLHESSYADPMHEKGFRLPDGDVTVGRASFLYMQCNQCHTIKGEELPRIPFGEPPYVELGGPTPNVRTFGELVTAITNPSHNLAAGYAEDIVFEDGESNMYNHNQFMTVQELADIVTFLQPYYQVIPADQAYRPQP